MLRSLVVLIVFAATASLARAQTWDPVQPPNTFRSADNPHYWANKLPEPGYWQQDVHYRIDALIDETTDIIHGVEELTYWNNSPDTLHRVYFHLYQNAFQPGSYYHSLYHNNGRDASFGRYEREGLGTTIQQMDMDGRPQETELDNTILIVHLDEPIPPNSSVTFDIQFKSFYDRGSMRRRMKSFNSYGAKEYNGAHWYPRIACYDSKFGWTTDQHLGREFYGDFGTFDVTLDFASNYIVGATGNLLNRDEVLPDSLRERIDVANFADKPWGEAPTASLPYVAGERKQWHYYAENVHDFAFVANPHFRIGEAQYRPPGTDRVITAYSFCQEPHCSGWQNAAEYTARILQVLSEDFGMYEYHKMIVADARDGMEYPMLTMDGGRDPFYRGLLVHEVAHNWFYGMLANNETYRAMMDEGFTQFATAWGLERIDGAHVVRPEPDTRYKKRFKEPRPVRDDDIYYGYMRDAILGEDPPLNTHSDQFGGAIRHGGGYGHVYYKTAAMLYNLQYVLGDELFLESMRAYVERWKFCHPYPEDFRQAIIDHAGTDLNWFFDQWLETSKSTDYRVGKVKQVEDDVFEITLKRTGRMQQPIDLRVLDDAGRAHDFHIPNTYFTKETDATVLPKWTGWDNVRPEYTARVELETDRIRDVIIDPSGRMPDVTPMNNRTRDRIDLDFESGIWNFPEVRNYQMYWRPDLRWNGYDGVQVGANLSGHYMYRKHRFDATVWFNTRLGQLRDLPIAEADFDATQRWSYMLDYATRLHRLGRDLDLEVHSRFFQGLQMNRLGLVKDFDHGIELSVFAKTMWRPDASDLNYLYYPTEWRPDAWNNSLNVRFERTHRKGPALCGITIDLRTAALLSDFDYHYVQAEYTNHLDLWKKKLQLRTRGFVRFGLGDDLAPESALFGAMANPEEVMDRPWARAVGAVPYQGMFGFGPDIDAQFQHQGGLNLRGYAGYGMFERDENGFVVPAYSGPSGAAINAELAFDRIVPIKNRWLRNHLDLDTYVFGDAGLLAFENSAGDTEWGSLRADAGVGAAITFKKFWSLRTRDLTIRFDVPFWVSHAPAGEENVAWRWQLGISRAF